MITNTITISLYIFDDYDYDCDLYFFNNYYDCLTQGLSNTRRILQSYMYICLLLLLINISFSNKLSPNLHKNSNIFLAQLETKRI